MNRDVVFRDAEGTGDQPPSALRRLRRRPDLHLAVLELGGAVLRLERRVGDERVEVLRLDDLGGALERGVHVAVFPERALRRLLRELGRLRGEARTALLGGRTLVPDDPERFPRFLRRP